MAMYSAQLAPTAPAPTTVTFIVNIIILICLKRNEASLFVSAKVIFLLLFYRQIQSKNSLVTTEHLLQYQ
jgi:hypothetical protein